MAINFKYERVGHIVMLQENDWQRIVKFLRKSGLDVAERTTNKRTQSAAEACGNFKKARDGKCFNCGFGKAAHR